MGAGRYHERQLDWTVPTRAGCRAFPRCRVALQEARHASCSQCGGGRLSGVVVNSSLCKAEPARPGHRLIRSRFASASSSRCCASGKEVADADAPCNNARAGGGARKRVLPFAWRPGDQGRERDRTMQRVCPGIRGVVVADVEDLMRPITGVSLGVNDRASSPSAHRDRRVMGAAQRHRLHALRPSAD